MYPSDQPTDETGLDFPQVVGLQVIYPDPADPTLAQVAAAHAEYVGAPNSYIAIPNRFKEQGFEQ